MTSGGTFPQRLTKIDDLTRPDHWNLTEEDDCYFLGEYARSQLAQVLGSIDDLLASETRP